MGLKHLEGVLDQVTQDEAFALRVLNLVTKVSVALLEQVHHGQNLAIVGHQSLADSVTAGHQALQNLKSDCDNLGVTSVKGSYFKKYL